MTKSIYEQVRGFLSIYIDTIGFEPSQLIMRHMADLLIIHRHYGIHDDLDSFILDNFLRTLSHTGKVKYPRLMDTSSRRI